jgi:hypothetical protein
MSGSPLKVAMGPLVPSSQTIETSRLTNRLAKRVSRRVMGAPSSTIP